MDGNGRTLGECTNPEVGRTLRSLRQRRLREDHTVVDGKIVMVEFLKTSSTLFKPLFKTS